MFFLNSSRALLQGMMAGALALASASACSRPDRNESGSDNTAALTQDTAAASTGTDTSAAGYRAMERDTASIPESDSVRVTEDTSEISQSADTAPVETAGAAQLPGTAEVSAEGQVTTDTTAIVASVDTTADRLGPPEDTTELRAGVGMARDTTTTADQIDTTGVAVTGGVAAEGAAGVAAGTPDTARASIVVTADTVESDRVRPPEDSTELYGNAISDETADEQEISAEDREAVAASDERTQEVGAAAIGGTVTGAQAVEMITRGDARCIVVDPESDEEVRWDMSSTPVTLNPCGLGSMVLSKVRAAGQRGGGAVEE